MSGVVSIVESRDSLIVVDDSFTAQARCVRDYGRPTYRKRRAAREFARGYCNAQANHPKPRPESQSVPYGNWPTADSVAAFRKALNGPWPGDTVAATLERALRAAMLSDPIIRAAKVLARTSHIDSAYSVIEAVRRLKP